MSSPAREVLYLAEAPDAVLMLRLQAYGWKTIPVDRAQRVAEITGRADLPVGLLQIPKDLVDPALLSEVVDTSPSTTRWIVLASKAHLERADLCKAIARYCYDYSTLPVDVHRLAVTIGRAYGMHALESVDREEDDDLVGRFGIVGTSRVIREARKSILTFARTDAPVLIRGETGTGKELAASAIHQLSRRSPGPFIPVNCGAFPETLIQSELFGHEKGAFTGAHARSVGKIASADGGTLLLDEIGELPLQQQVNLLRFLQELKVQRVGSSVEVGVDARILAATNADLEQSIRQGVFREDLFYRLNVLVLRIPPLRERQEDIEQLAHAAFEKHLHERVHAVRGLSRTALRAMQEYSWPGNVRELINRVRRAMIVCETGLIGVSDLGLTERGAQPRAETLEEARARAEREVLAATLGRTGGNISASARRLNITRTTLYRLIRKHALDQMDEHVEPASSLPSVLGESLCSAQSKSRREAV